MKFLRILQKIAFKALAIFIALSILVLFSLSAVFNLRPSLFLGSSEAGPYTELGIEEDLPGSVPTPGLSASFEQPTIALTFDDGIDPVYTPQVLDVLNSFGIKATFFVIGENLPANKQILQDMVSSGHEVGLHSYSHDRMGDLSNDHNLRQYELTQKYIFAITGTSPYIARPPYSSTARNLSEREHRAASFMQDSNYVMVFSDLSPPDYNPAYSSEDIAAASIPEDNQSAILTLHDGGGNSRERTVEALTLLIPRLQDAGYQFQTVSDYAGLAEPVPVSDKERFLAQTVLWVTFPYRMFETFFYPVLLFTSAVLAVRFVFSMFFALSYWWKERRKSAPKNFYPSVTVIVPAYNEEVGIVDALLSIKNTAYQGPLEILVVDDGSTDDTRSRALTVSGVRVITKENGGKATALNVGIAEANYDICVLIDGDTVFDANTIPRLVEPFHDPRVGAVSGNPKVGNGDVNILTRVQHLEYLVGCSLDRRMQTELNIVSCIPGAAGAYRRSILQNVGGLDSSTLAEDTDLTVRVGSQGWKIGYATKAFAFTEVPATVRSLWKQRVRWSYGVTQTIWKNKRKSSETVNNVYRLSVVSYLFILNLIIALIAPLADVLTLTYLLRGQLPQVVKAYILIIAIQLFATLLAAILDGEKPKYLYLTFFQAIFYRIFNFLIALVALSSAISGKREKWNKPKREGLATQNIQGLDNPTQEREKVFS